MTILDLQKKISEGDAKLKQQQNMYEAVRSDRNLYSKNLIESQAKRRPRAPAAPASATPQATHPPRSSVLCVPTDVSVIPVHKRSCSSVHSPTHIPTCLPTYLPTHRLPTHQPTSPPNYMPTNGSTVRLLHLSAVCSACSLTYLVTYLPVLAYSSSPLPLLASSARLYDCQPTHRPGYLLSS
eukprot:5296959-Pleurochrysis_carterae.AAC.1